MPEALIHFLRICFSYKKFKTYQEKITIDNDSFNFLIGDPTGEKWYEGSNQELSQEMLFTKKMVRPGEIVIEVGPHHGFFTILLSKWVGKEGKILAIEASPHNSKILKENIDINGISNVTVENKAAGSIDGHIYIRGGSNSNVVNSLWNAAYKVKLTKLDNYSYLSPTFLKIDVEGYEVDVLKGAGKILELKPNLAIEVHFEQLKKYGYSIKDIFDLIDKKSYTLWLQPDGKTPPFVYDNRNIEPIEQLHLYAIRK